MIIQCSHCGKDIVRHNRIKNAVCFECKRIRDKKNYLKNKPDREVQGVGKRNEELYNISWKEIRRRLIPIDKESDLRKFNKKLKHKLYA